MPSPLRSRAEVFFYWREERAIERIAERLFDHELAPRHYAGLAGAPDAAHVHVGTYHDGLYLDTSDPVAAHYRTIQIVRRVDDRLVIVNDRFHVHAKRLQRKGLGLKIFHRQVDNARSLGIARIETLAGRRADENGYYTWPRFGFDGPIPKELRPHLPPQFQHARTILDLIETKPGRQWWRDHGRTIEVHFDLSPHSRSQQVFHQYLQERGLAGP